MVAFVNYNQANSIASHYKLLSGTLVSCRLFINHLIFIPAHTYGHQYGCFSRCLWFDQMFPGSWKVIGMAGHLPAT